VVQLARDNISLNGVTDIAYSCLLKWNNEIAANEILERHTRSQSSDSAQCNGCFDIIIASDCLYGSFEVAVDLFKLASKLLIRNVNASSTCCDNGWYYPSTYYDDLQQRAIPKEPALILGYTRRFNGSETDIEALFKAASDVGFKHSEAFDCIIDMFGNVTSYRTIMWEHCIFIFTWEND